MNYTRAMTETPQWEGPKFESGPEKRENNREFLPTGQCSTCIESGSGCIYLASWEEDNGHELRQRMYEAIDRDCPNLPPEIDVLV